MILAESAPSFESGSFRRRRRSRRRCRPSSSVGVGGVHAKELYRWGTR